MSHRVISITLNTHPIRQYESHMFESKNNHNFERTMMCYSAEEMAAQLTRAILIIADTGDILEVVAPDAVMSLVPQTVLTLLKHLIWEKEIRDLIKFPFLNR